VWANFAGNDALLGAVVSNAGREAMSVLETNSNPGDFARGATVLGRYVIDRCLRRERLGSVYAARDQSGLWVSVWAARRDQITRGADSPDRFSRAVTALAAATHPSLPSLLAWDIELDTPIIVSALKPGRSLRELITTDGFIAIDDVSRVVTAVGAALHALHHTTPPIAHGGVSPERVQLSDDGRVWLEEGGYLHALVSAGLVAPPQTVAYASTGYALPSDRVGRLDAHADTFQLAVLAFEALTGQLPFGASQPSEVSAALAGSSPPTPSSLRLGLSQELDELFLSAWRVGTPDGPASLVAFTRDLTRILGEDRNRRPTFPGADSPSRLRAIDPQLAGLVGRSRGASALDTVDRAFDAMLAPHDEPPPLPTAAPSKPPVIEFGAPEEPPSQPLAVPGAVDVTPVKPTLVGANPVDPNERPAVSDQPTPSVGYERLKLLASDALRDVDTAVRPTPVASAEPPTPDATTRIEEGILDTLRKNTLAARAQQTGAKKDAPRVPSLAPRGVKASVPPPPESATRPSASQFPPGKRRRTSKPPREGADARPSSNAPEGDGIDFTIPKAPKLPGEVHTMVGHAPMPPRLPSIGPEVILDAPEPLDEVAVVATQDILDADLPEGARHSPEPIKPAAPATATVSASSAESTQITGTPLPPRPAVSHRPPPVPEAVPERHAPPPPTPSKRPTPADDDVITRPVGTPLRAPPPPAPKPEPRETRPPGDRTSVTQTVRASALPPPPHDNSWAVAAKWCAISTVVSALLVTAGFAYLRDTHRELIEELRLAREQAARVPVVDAATPEDAAPAPADVPVAPAPLDAPAADAAPDATVVADAPDAAAREAGARSGPPADATAAVVAPTGEGVPDATARSRMSGAMRGAISDCVEGVEDPPFVLVEVRYDGRTGAATRVRLHGIFQEAPMGPCIEHAVREVRAPTFSAPSWDAEFRFPVPQPRWRPGQTR
jgi:serine/threonine protein kinase